MRYSWLALGGLLALGAAPAPGQQPQPQQQPASPLLNPNDRLDALLMQWEAKMKAVTSLSARVVRQDEDKTFRTRRIFEGVAKYKKPNLALLHLRMKDRPEIFEKLVCTDAFIYHYNLDTREIRIYETNPKGGQVGDDSFLSFLFEIKATEAKRRYDISFYKNPDQNVHETDKYYYFLKIMPRLDMDRADFQGAYLALNRTTMLPRTLVLIDPKNNQVQWDIPVIESGVEVDRSEFTKPELPAGWQFRKMPSTPDARTQKGDAPPPRVVRPKP